MITRTIYVPANALGRYVLENIWDVVSCSMGEIKKVGSTLAVPVTMPEREVIKVERILQMFDLL